VTTVEEILKQRPQSLRERAAAALQLEKKQKEEELAAENEELQNEVIDWLTVDLGLPSPQIMDTEFEWDRYNSERGCVTWSFEGFDFRAHYILKKLFEKESTMGKETIYEKVIVFEIARDNSKWKQIATLADIGRLL
jgi:aminopeptidase C